MKFTLSWLKDHLETDATLNEICERLTAIGLEVEDVDDKAAYQPFTIAKVVSAEQHPNADKLRVLMVDKGDGKPVQIVCGAPNARAGLIGALAEPGTYVPGIDVTLAVGNIRGVESHGMMCSEKELDMSEDHDGIIDLPEDAPVGSSFAAYAGLDDPVIEINLTPNRPDCTSIYGIARDLAASGLGKLKAPKAPDFPVEGETAQNVKIILDDESLCPGFAWRLVRGVKNGPSPKWMQKRLIAIGLSAHLGAGRRHQLHDLRPGPADARLRRRQGQGRPRCASRARRRGNPGARHPHLQAQPRKCGDCR
jgi:phenylalanyl-tRNA synthetase beta chain